MRRGPMVVLPDSFDFLYENYPLKFSVYNLLTSCILFQSSPYTPWTFTTIRPTVEKDSHQKWILKTATATTTSTIGVLTQPITFMLFSTELLFFVT